MSYETAFTVTLFPTCSASPTVPVVSLSRAPTESLDVEQPQKLEAPARPANRIKVALCVELEFRTLCPFLHQLRLLDAIRRKVTSTSRSLATLWQQVEYRLVNATLAVEPQRIHVYSHPKYFIGVFSPDVSKQVAPSLHERHIA